MLKCKSITLSIFTGLSRDSESLIVRYGLTMRWSRPNQNLPEKAKD
jgi:hypothetical protein